MINKHFNNVSESYLFSTIAQRVNAYKEKNPDAPVIRLGIGDVTLPLCAAVTGALLKGAAEMGTPEGFHGYGPEQGYAFLREAAAEYYKTFGVVLDPDEVFISDGAKSDLGNITDLFSTDCAALIPDPVYPVYADTNTMNGRKIIFLAATPQNGFLPLPDETLGSGIVYLCSPNNPTGAAYSREQLKLWVDWANKTGSVLLFDSAYESFVADNALPRSIFEIDGARTCAIEFCSLSKTAGFTGLRCGYTVIPRALEREGSSLHKMWFRRQSTKFNGVPYPVQRAAAAVFSKEGQREIRANIDYYRENAKIITDTLDKLGIYYTGGNNSPYVWLACPDNLGSWEFFDLLLEKANVVGTPGEGFGENGKGMFRLTSFNTHENTKTAMERFEYLLKK